MAASAQKRASAAYRQRLAAAGLKRFEVRAPAADQALIRKLAGKLAQGDADAARIRADLSRTVAEGSAPKGGVLAALRRAPPEAAELDLQREEVALRPLGL